MAYLTDLISDLAIFNIFIHFIKSYFFIWNNSAKTVYKILIVPHILCTWAEGKV